MKMKKIVATGSALALTAAVAVGGTLAWLTATVDPITNSFTFNENGIKMELDETFPENKIYPGAELQKEPVLTVKANSEPCYVYAQIENGFTVDEATIDIQSAWTLVDGTTNIYRYNQVVLTSTSDQALTALFTKVTVDTDLDSDALATAASKTIVIDGYAIQSNGGMTQDDADDAAIAYFA